LFSYEKVLSLWRNSKLMDAMLIGREKEKQVLQNALNEEYSQLVAVYVGYPKV